MVYVLFIIAVFYGSFPALAETPINQNIAQQQAEQLNRIASDRSMENSTVYAMQALMDLSSANVPSAVKNGVSAYGKYRNSQGLDRIGDLSNAQSAAMSSSGGTPIKKTITSYKRLDPSFLHKGEAAKIAEKFEQLSGMKRETFLTEIGTISENRISKKDPRLVDKVLSKFENFTKKIPNKEFRANIEKSINMVPQTVRTGLIANAVSKFANLFASTENPSSATYLKTNTELLNISSDQQTQSREPSSSDKASALNTLANKESEISKSDDNYNTNQQEASLRYRIGEEIPEAAKGALGNVVQAAISSQEEGITIFQQVSRKIRKLTPKLVEIKKEI